MTKKEVEYVSLSRDTTETDLKQRREIVSSSAVHVDQVNRFILFINILRLLTILSGADSSIIIMLSAAAAAATDCNGGGGTDVHQWESKHQMHQIGTSVINCFLTP